MSDVESKIANSVPLQHSQTRQDGNGLLVLEGEREGGRSTVTIMD